MAPSPRFNSGGWTEEEHRLFLEGLDTYGRGKWEEISQVIKTRSSTQVVSHEQHWRKKNGLNASAPLRAYENEDGPAHQPTESSVVNEEHVSPRRSTRATKQLEIYTDVARKDEKEVVHFNKGKWTEEEDRRFLVGLRKYGRGKWYEIANVVKTRNNLQVYQRAQPFIRNMDNGIDIFAELEVGGEASIRKRKRKSSKSAKQPKAKKNRSAPRQDTKTRKLKDNNSQFNLGKWSDEESRLFLIGLQKFGKGKWAQICSLIPTRSIQQVKARGSSIAKKIERGVDVFADLEDSSFIGQYNEGSWSEEENRLLLVGIRKYGKGSWLQIEQVVKTRSRFQAKSRFQKYEKEMKAGINIFADLQESESDFSGVTAASTRTRGMLNASRKKQRKAPLPRIRSVVCRSLSTGETNEETDPCVERVRKAILGETDTQDLVSELGLQKLNSKKADAWLGKGVGSRVKFTSSDVTEVGFRRHAAFMKIVNDGFSRLLDQPGSRPRLKSLEIADASMSKIKSVFFDSDGSLRNEMKNCIEMSEKHGYINFQNVGSAENAPKDRRWQLPVKQHGRVSTVGPRAELAEELHAHGIIDLQYEELDDVGMLIGGTEDQCLHHDVSRTLTSFAPSGAVDPEGKYPLVGWEIGRPDYNAAMASPHAPISVILGMYDSQKVLLGVQNDQIRRVGTNKCTIIGGTGEVLDIVRERKHLVVIEVDKGVMFTGDFPHAGVRNVPEQSPENELLEKLNRNISAILKDANMTDRQHLSAIVDMLCEFPGLNKLCRLFCSTQQLHGVKNQRNEIGFTSCFQNSPGHADDIEIPVAAAEVHDLSTGHAEEDESKRLLELKVVEQEYDVSGDSSSQADPAVQQSRISKDSDNSSAHLFHGITTEGKQNTLSSAGDRGGDDDDNVPVTSLKTSFVPAKASAAHLDDRNDDMSQRMGLDAEMELVDPKRTNEKNAQASPKLNDVEDRSYFLNTPIANVGFRESDVDRVMHTENDQSAVVKARISPIFGAAVGEEHLRIEFLESDEQEDVSDPSSLTAHVETASLQAARYFVAAGYKMDVMHQDSIGSSNEAASSIKAISPTLMVSPDNRASIDSNESKAADNDDVGHGSMNQMEMDVLLHAHAAASDSAEHEDRASMQSRGHVDFRGPPCEGSNSIESLVLGTKTVECMEEDE